MNYRERLGNQFYKARKEKGLTQKTLAGKCGLHGKDISNIENGSINTGFDRLVSVAEHLGGKIKLIIDKEN